MKARRRNKGREIKDELSSSGTKISALQHIVPVKRFPLFDTRSLDGSAI